MLIKEMSTASETRQRVHGMTYRYELEKYPFREELEKLFGLDLQDLHLWLGNFEKFDDFDLLSNPRHGKYKEELSPYFSELKLQLKTAFFPKTFLS